MAVNKKTERTSSRGDRSDPTDQSDPTDPTDQTGHHVNLDGMSALDINGHQVARSFVAASP